MMGKSISISIGNETFPSKTDARNFVRRLVARYAIGEYLTADDKAFCVELFRRHPGYPGKLSPGVERIQVRIQEKGTTGFQIYKSDGKDDNISWTDCLGKESLS
jgi:hypothetical protein